MHDSSICKKHEKVHFCPLSRGGGVGGTLVQYSAIKISYSVHKIYFLIRNMVSMVKYDSISDNRPSDGLLLSFIVLKQTVALFDLFNCNCGGGRWLTHQVNTHI